ncbi:FtsX-like permease family protein [Flagellimonas sp. DF-77]|uniref:ABC transporter permease n=1 Tax=Flagellimonas algarum TaxID=3230298 RepID=UPI003394DFE5
MISKPLNMVLSLLLLVLSVSLVTFILQLSQQLNGQMDKNIAPVDMVVGAKGSPLQLVLSSVLHIDAPTGNIPLKEAEPLMTHPFVKMAIPVSYGDNYKGYRLLGTEPSYIDAYGGTLANGRLFKESFEVVAGHQVATKLGLQVGDTFVGAHGLAAEAIDVHDDKPYTVVGILNPTSTVLDQLLISNLASIWEAHDHEGHDHGDEAEHDHDDHDHEGHDHDDHDHEDEGHDHEEHPGEGHDHSDDSEAAHEHKEEDLEITSLLVKFKNPMALVQLPRSINENTNMQAALPGFEIQRLTGLLGSGVKTINGIALAILFVSGFSIFISLLKTIRERRQELALLRTYGLGTRKLLYLVLFEGLFLAVLGFVAGWLLGRLALKLVSNYMIATYGYALDISGPDLTELWFFVATLLISGLAVLLASTSIFKLDISKVLANE